ncbi:hypothetical protein PQX77_001105 [Marasmius sp. AFHP31]|nr:hypothetical protein PQX77_001105 [Marasmius sp. AFHP31]
MPDRSSSLTPIEESSSDSPPTSPSRPPRNQSTDSSSFESQLRAILPTKPPLERTVPCPRTRTPSAEDAVSLASDPGVVYSSPIVGPRAARVQKAREKGRKKRAATMAERRSEKEALDAELRRKGLVETLDDLHKRGLGFGDLFDFVFDSDEYQGHIRYQEFYRKQGRVTKALTQWMSNETARNELHHWAVQYVEGVVRKEAKGITTDAHLRRPLTPEMLTSFSFLGLRKKFDDWAPTTMRLFSAFSTSARQLREGLSSPRLARKSLVQVIAATSCLGEYSRLNTLTKNINSLFLYARGAQRQITAVLSHFGLSSSYSTLVQKENNRPAALTNEPLPPSTTAPLLFETPIAENDSDDGSSDSTYYPPSSDSESDADDHIRERKSTKNGILPRLAEQLRQRVRRVVATGLFGGVFDNINFMSKVGEQIVGRTDTQENGTTYTFWKLLNATLDALSLSEYLKSFDTASGLAPNDIFLSAKEEDLSEKCMVHCIARVIVNHGGVGFERFSSDMKKSMPVSEYKIPVQRTEIYPLPAMDIDESTIVGNVDVDKAVVEETGMKNTSWWMKIVRIIGGDQLSLARIRSIFTLRAGKEGGYSGFGWAVCFTGLFHAKMADIQGTLLTHWGKPNAGTRNPGCLAFHNTILHRLPITLSSLPTFRICRDLILVSLYGRILHLLLTVSGAKSLEAYAKTATWDRIMEHSQQIYNTYIDIEAVHDLRQSREQQKKDRVTEGDMVYENAVLFLRDALLSREFADAVKFGDSGRIILVLKQWTFSYRGNGRTKYAYEMLHLLHNITHVWPKPLCNVILNNWLLNLQGKDDSFVEVDLVQEHLNYWIKRVYKAHGSNNSWEWLSMISPCIDVLRKLATNMAHSVGEATQGSRHAAPDLSKDIATIIESLEHHKVYKIIRGRVLDNDDLPVRDVISEGISQLSGPLQEYNATFKSLQARRRQEPTVGGMDPGIKRADVTSSMEGIEEAQTVVGRESLAETSVFSDVFQGEMAEVFDREDVILSLQTAEDVSLDMDVLED